MTASVHQLVMRRRAAVAQAAANALERDSIVAQAKDDKGSLAEDCDRTAKAILSLILAVTKPAAEP